MADLEVPFTSPLIHWSGTWTTNQHKNGSEVINLRQTTQAGATAQITFIASSISVIGATQPKAVGELPSAAWFFSLAVEGLPGPPSNETIITSIEDSEWTFHRTLIGTNGYSLDYNQTLTITNMVQGSTMALEMFRLRGGVDGRSPRVFDATAHLARTAPKVKGPEALTVPQIVGISLGSVAFVAIMGIALFFLLRRRSRSANNGHAVLLDTQDDHQESEALMLNEMQQPLRNSLIPTPFMETQSAMPPISPQWNTHYKSNIPVVVASHPAQMDTDDSPPPYIADDHNASGSSSTGPTQSIPRDRKR